MSVILTSEIFQKLKHKKVLLLLIVHQLQTTSLKISQILRKEFIQLMLIHSLDHILNVIIQIKSQRTSYDDPNKARETPLYPPYMSYESVSLQGQSTMRTGPTPF